MGRVASKAYLTTLISYAKFALRSYMSHKSVGNAKFPSVQIAWKLARRAAQLALLVVIKMLVLGRFIGL
jgi:hypothetical protein